MAECPVHFDARNMNALIERNELKAAYEQYKKAVLFPGIVSEQCDATCEKKCKRTEAGGSVAVKELERVINERGKHEIEVPKSNTKINKKPAIVEDGLDAMAIIYTLRAKGYSPELFTSKKEITVTNDDFDFINDDDIIKHTMQKLDESLIKILTENYDAVYFGNHTKEGFYSIFGGVSDNPKYFFSIDTNSVIQKISYGKQTAVSLDRFLKGVSMTAGRKNEGSYESQLFTSISDIERKEQTPKEGNFYTEEEATAEAQRCIQCRCMKCVKECMLLEKYEKYPRKYIREVFNNIATGGLGHSSGKPMINSCTLCGLCGEICPNRIPMAEIYHSAREHLIRRDKMPPRYHDFPLRDMLYSNSDAASFFRRPKGKNKSKYLFFPGCQLAAINSEYIKPMYEYLSNILADEAGLMLGCCGAPALWAGRGEIYDEVMGKFRETWEQAEKPVIITACPTCNREFSEALPDAEVQTIWRYYSENELPDSDGALSGTPIHPPCESADGAGQAGRIVSIHDPCTTRHRDDMHEEIRKILIKKGYSLEELEYAKNKTRCCGYGGLVSYIDPSLAKEFADKRVSETEHDLVTYCAVCRDFIANGEKPIYHILDIIYGNSDREKGIREKIGISEKVKIRAELKKQLLRQIWGEEPADEPKEYDDILLLISDDVRKKLEDRLILEDNIKEIIHEAEKTGGKLVNPKSGHFIAYKMIGIVTYWVEYEKSGELFYIHSAYSHRIRVLEEKNANRISGKRNE